MIGFWDGAPVTHIDLPGLADADRWSRRDAMASCYLLTAFSFEVCFSSTSLPAAGYLLTGSYPLIQPLFDPLPFSYFLLQLPFLDTELSLIAFIR
jgi:hypothetical protein